MREGAAILVSPEIAHSRFLRLHTLVSREPGAVHQELVIVRRASPLSLNNTGDTVRLKDPTGTVRSERSYTGNQVQRGQEIRFQ